MKIQPGVGYTFDSSNKGFTLDTSDPFPNQQEAPNTQFRPYDQGDGNFSVTPGTINGVIPCCDGIDVTKLITRIPAPKIEYDWSATESGYKSCYIYLQASPAAGSDGKTWPAAAISDEGYPVIYGYPYTMEDDDTTGYLLLALAQKNAESGAISFTPFVTTSIWSERHKYSQPNSAYYYYYRL